MRTRAILAAFWWALAAGAPAFAADFACGPTPTLRCVAPRLFSLIKSSHAEEYMRDRARIAETQMAPANLAVAVAYLIDDNGDPLPWELIHYLARAGLFDVATAEARHMDSASERIGGLLAVARQLVDAKVLDQAEKILTEVAPLLPSLGADDPFHAARAAEIWALLGRFDDVARTLSEDSAAAIIELLAIASKYPVQAEALRRQAWAQAERINDRIAWQIVTEHASQHGDTEMTSRAAQRALQDSTDLDRTIRIATALLKVGLRQQAGKALDHWPTSVRENRAPPFHIAELIPVLVELGRDGEVGAAVKAVIKSRDRGRSLIRAADLLFSAGRSNQAARLELAVSMVAQDNSTLHNLALAQARRGHVPGALDLAAENQKSGGHEKCRLLYQPRRDRRRTRRGGDAGDRSARGAGPC